MIISTKLLIKNGWKEKGSWVMIMRHDEKVMNANVFCHE